MIPDSLRETLKPPFSFSITNSNLSQVITLLLALLVTVKCRYSLPDYSLPSASSLTPTPSETMSNITFFWSKNTKFLEETSPNDISLGPDIPFLRLLMKSWVEWACQERSSLATKTPPSFKSAKLNWKPILTKWHAQERWSFIDS